jgi:hypothetical protein
MEEIWKPVPSFPGWEASSLGRVRHVPRWSEARGRFYGGKAQTGTKSRSKLTVQKFGHSYPVHRMVCEAFNGPAPADKPNCLHSDECFWNNRPENLRWGTQSENMREPKLRASWTREKEAAARRKAWETRRNRQESAA